jgi:hypothetical protein
MDGKYYYFLSMFFCFLAVGEAGQRRLHGGWGSVTANLQTTGSLQISCPVKYRIRFLHTGGVCLHTTHP